MPYKPKNRRRKYFIRKRFQGEFMLKFCTLVIIGAVISGTIVFMMSRSTVTTTFENSRLTIKSTADFILPAVLMSSAVVIVLVGLMTIYLTLFTTHRIVGPIYRIEKDVDEVASGNLTKRFVVRKSDEAQELASSLDRMTEIIKASVSDIKSTLSELDDTMNDYESKEKKPLPRKLKEKVKEMRSTLTKFRT